LNSAIVFASIFVLNKAIISNGVSLINFSVAFSLNQSVAIISSLLFIVQIIFNSLILVGNVNLYSFALAKL